MTTAERRSGSQSWPKNAKYRDRYLVPDLSAEARPELKGLKPRLIFVAESPHEAETAPADQGVRRPLCGRAGQSFWKMIGEQLGGQSSSDTSLERLLELVRKGQFAVLNAVQYPLDPKITLYYGEAVDPVLQLGFSKVPPASYKKLKSTREVECAVEELKRRLVHPSLRSAPIISLGNDAQWFVAQAVSPVGTGRHLMTIPHPSAWWRQGGKLREKAREKLELLLNPASLQRLQNEASSQASLQLEDKA